MEKTLKPLVSSPAADPVCGEPVGPIQNALKINHNGTPVYFCSRKCLKAFKADPEKYGYPKHKGFLRRYIERMEKVNAENPKMCGG